MKLRVFAAGILAVAGLAGCQTKVGQAAVVGGHRISDSEVADYVTRSGPSAQAQAQAKTAIEPRVLALSTLIQEQVFTHTLDALGVKHAPADLAAVHDEAAQRLFGATTTGEAVDQAITAQVKQFGLAAAYGTLAIRVAELEDLLINATQATSIADLAAAAKKHAIGISVSGRYGTWDAKNLQLSSDPESGLPSFVTFGPGATADANQ